MNLDVIAEIVATSFNADRPVLHRYSAAVVLHAPDKNDMMTVAEWYERQYLAVRYCPTI